jgi:hypothetical protein
MSFDPVPPTSTIRPKVFGQVMKGHDNNFDFIRLALASAVIFSHSAHALNRTGTETDPFFGPTLHQLFMADFAVCGFFAASGCLVTGRCREPIERFALTLAKARKQAGSTVSARRPWRLPPRGLPPSGRTSP